MVDTVVNFRVQESMLRKLDRLVQENYMASRGEYLRAVLREKIQEAGANKNDENLSDASQNIDNLV